ncbi:MAG: flagellar biosynthetic protein FliR [Aquificota bacterium]|nr:MAG: flagellar biosynthetic protein FliR [Aquificota bacterium]
MSFDIEALLTLFLMYVRIVFFFLLVPFFGKEFLPNTFKVFLATAVAFAIFLYQDVKPVEFPTTAHYIGAIIREALFGFVAGLMLRLFFDALQVAGEFISVNMGLGLATLFLPQQPQTTILAVLFTLMGSLLFIAIGGPEVVLLALAKSFSGYPPGTFSLYELNPEEFLNFFYHSFNLAFRIALPVLVVMLLFNLVLALINRFIPQINVFIVGLPLQLFIGLGVLILTFPLVYAFIKSHLREYIIKFTLLVGG